MLLYRQLTYVFETGDRDEIAKTQYSLFHTSGTSTENMSLVPRGSSHCSPYNFTSMTSPSAYSLSILTIDCMSCHLHRDVLKESAILIDREIGKQGKNSTRIFWLRLLDIR